MNNSSAGSWERRRVLVLVLLGLLVAGFIVLAATYAGRNIAMERQMIQALQSTNRDGTITGAGVETVRRIDQQAVSILLRWSEGRDPRWYKFINPVRKVLKMPPLGGEFWERKEMARKGFAILRERATPAVPRLSQRLADPDPDVRRFSVTMLAAIGPAMGSGAFQRMTNCLADTNQNVRNDVVWAMQFHRPEEYPAETLLAVYGQGLQDPFNVARQNAMIGLMRMGKKAAPARALIEKALNDPDRGVKSMAHSILDELGKE